MKMKQRRLDIYRPFSDWGNPEDTGTIANDKDFDLGTPNLDRHEDVVFIASNTEMKECLLVRLKWRPDTDKRQVTLISRLNFVIGEDVYEFEQVDTYKPSYSSLRPGRILQYGSASSKLKFYLASPYRRMRLVFNGHVRKRGELGSNKLFLKLSCVVSPLAQLFDFLEQYDEDCLKQLYAMKKPVRTFDQVVSNLLLHDRHEQKVRLSGAYLLVDHQTNTRTQESFSLWGFYARHFTEANSSLERNISTRRLYAFMNNGQAFQIGTRKFDADQIEFGHTSFEVQPKTGPIDKPYKLDWQSVALGTQEFELEVSGQGHTFKSRASKKLDGWHHIETNGKPGWAWVSLDDQVVNSPEESEAISLSRAARERALKAGQRAGLLEAEPTDGEPLVVSIEDEICASSKLVGSKASSLAQLLLFTKKQAKDLFKVPHAFVLTKSAHDLLLAENESLRESVAKLTELVGQGETTHLRAECKSIEDLVREQAKLPQSIADELWAHLKKHYGAEKVDSEELRFAVRSSSWGEDEEDMSAAGQLDTILNVKFSLLELARAIMSCFASKFSYENIEYKRQHGMPLDLPMAIIVQEMIACEKAGVMFTCDPATGDESLFVITANFGLGESVVSARADPDSITVRNLHLDIETVGSESNTSQDEFVIGEVKIGAKNVVISHKNDGEDEQDYDRSKCCLSDGEILRLAACGRSIKQYFWSQRRDVEWGYLADQLYLFQSRPVTGLETYSMDELMREADRPSQAELGYYTRANIGEVMPYAIRPFTLTFSVFGWNTAGARLYSKYTDDVVFVPQCSSEVFHEKYHAFFNLRCSTLLPLGEEERSVLGKAMEVGFFGREMGAQPEIIEASKGFNRAPNPFASRRFSLMTMPTKLMPTRTIMREKAVMDRLRADVRELKFARGYAENKMLGLYTQLCALPRYLFNCWENHIVIIMFATNSNMTLTAILSKYIKDPMQLSSATNKFLAISPDVISAEIPSRVGQMAKQIESLGREELESFTALSHDKQLEYVRSKSEKLSKLFDEFMERFGHRCYNEFELAEFAWREQPEQIVDWIRMNCLGLLAKLDSTGDKAAEPTKPRPQSIEEVIQSLGIDMSLKDKLLVKHMFAPKCQLMLALREKTKNILILYTDILREASRMLAEEMQRHLRIPDKELFYYLMFDEIKPLIDAHQPAVVAQAIRRRHMFERSFDELWKFDEIIKDIIPNHMKPTRELDEAIAQAPKLMGTPASSGKVQGKICLVDGFKDLDKVRAGTILLTHSTDIAFSPIFPLISGIITDVGGLISHGAVVAREYGLPSVIGIPDATRILQDGEEVILDADNGVIIRLSVSRNSE